MNLKTVFLIGLITAIITACGRSDDADAHTSFTTDGQNISQTSPHADALAAFCITEGGSSKECDCFTEGMASELSENELKIAAEMFEGDMETTERVALNSKLDSRTLSDLQRQEMTEFSKMLDALAQVLDECNAKHQSN